MKNIDLFIGCFPGGVQFCDKSKYKNGDYKKLAFVRPYGQINYETHREKIPADIVQRIEQEARTARERFEAETRRNWEIDRIRTYYKMLDYMRWEDVKAVTNEKDDNKKLELIIRAYERPESYEVTI